MYICQFDDFVCDGNYLLKCKKDKGKIIQVIDEHILKMFWLRSLSTKQIVNLINLPRLLLINLR